MTTDQQSECAVLRMEARGVPLLYAGDKFITSINGWAGASLNEQIEWAIRFMTAVNERPNLLLRIKRLEEVLNTMPCPRPCNGRPDDFTTAQCIAANECGCSHRAALTE